MMCDIISAIYTTLQPAAHTLNLGKFAASPPIPGANPKSTPYLIHHAPQFTP